MIYEPLQLQSSVVTFFRIDFQPPTCLSRDVTQFLLRRSVDVDGKKINSIIHWPIFVTAYLAHAYATSFKPHLSSQTTLSSNNHAVQSKRIARKQPERSYFHEAW